MRLVRLAHAAWKQSSLGPSRPSVILDAQRRSGGRDRSIWRNSTMRTSAVRRQRFNASRTRSRCSPDALAKGRGPAYCTGVGKAMLAFMRTRTWLDARLQTAEHFTASPNQTISRQCANCLEELERGSASEWLLGFDRRRTRAEGIICDRQTRFSLDARQSVLGGLSVTALHPPVARIAQPSWRSLCADPAGHRDTDRTRMPTSLAASLTT